MKKIADCPDCQSHALLLKMWRELEKAYDYGSNDKRISLRQFKRVWQTARDTVKTEV